jgi:hypothetical protein
MEASDVKASDPAQNGRVQVTSHLRRLKHWKNHSCQHVLFDMTDYPVIIIIIIVNMLVLTPIIDLHI